MDKKQTEEKTAFDEPVFSWEAPEYIHHEKGWLWLVIVGGLWAVLILYALYSEAWTFAVALLIFGGVYAVLYHEKPKKVQVKISRMGIKFGNAAIPFSRMKAFWVHYEPPFAKNLKIRTHNYLYPDYAIPLENQNPAEIREYLASQIHELQGMDESLSEIFIRLLKL